MAKPLPSRFNPDLMARDGARFEAQIPLTAFARLAALVRRGSADPGSADPGSAEGDVQPGIDQAVVRATAGFSRRKDHIVIAGRLAAQYPLDCQRCLAPMVVDVDAPYELTFVDDEAAALALPDELDPVVLDETGHISSIALFEDELILHVPLIPRHDDIADCAPLPSNVATDVAQWHPDETDGGARKNPFEVLKKLDLH